MLKILTMHNGLEIYTFFVNNKGLSFKGLLIVTLLGRQQRQKCTSREEPGCREMGVLSGKNIGNLSTTTYQVK